VVFVGRFNQVGSDIRPRALRMSSLVAQPLGLTDGLEFRLFRIEHSAAGWPLEHRHRPLAACASMRGSSECTSRWNRTQPALRPRLSCGALAHACHFTFNNLKLARVRVRRDCQVVQPPRSRLAAADSEPQSLQLEYRHRSRARGRRRRLNFPAADPPAPSIASMSPNLNTDVYPCKLHGATYSVA